MQPGTLTVDVQSPHTLTGSRTAALRQFKRDGHVLWVRANGSATYFYTMEGRRHQRTWSQITLRPI